MARPQLSLDGVSQFIDLVEVARTKPASAASVEGSDNSVAAADYRIAHARIRALLERSSDGLPRALVWSLGHPIEVTAVLGRCPIDVYAAFRGVCDAINQVEFVAPLEDKDAWVDAILVDRAFRSASGTELFDIKIDSRGSMVGTALKRLEGRGFQPVVTAFGVGLTVDDLVRACGELEVLIRRLGGAPVISNIFATLRQSGRIYEGLFLYGRRTSSLSQLRPLSPPWHFLYNLALKHLAVTPTSLNPPGDWAALVAQAQDIAASIDVEVYSSFAWISISPHALSRAILDHTFYDELFSFQQWSADGADQLFQWWLDALVEARCELPLMGIDDWREFGRSLIAKAAPYQLSVTDPLDHASLRLAADRVAKIMAALACKSAAVNAGYRTPEQTTERDAPFFPLIALPNGRYFVPPRGLAARNLYERLSELIRKASSRDGDLANKFGRALELLAEKVLRASGHMPTEMRCLYDHPTLAKPYEFDFVLEAEGRVTLIECKMKALTRPSRGTHTVQALLDFSQSFLEALAQLLRHELALRSCRELALQNGRSLALGDRSIDRIVLTMLDHGSLQSPTFIRTILPALWGVQLNSDGSEITGALTKINEKIVDVQSHLATLAKLAGEEIGPFLQRLGFGTWWLSIDQLSLISRGQSDLGAGLDPIRHITFQTGDLINELANSNLMRTSAPTL